MTGLASVKLTNSRGLRGNTGHASWVSTHALKAYEMTMPSIEAMALIFVAMLLLALLLVLVVGAIAREWVRQKTQRENKDKALLDVIQSVHTGMSVVAERIHEKGELAKDNHSQVIREFHEVAELVLCIERRLEDQIKENREVIRESRREATKIYNQLNDGQTQASQGEHNKHER